MLGRPWARTIAKRYSLVNSNLRVFNDSSVLFNEHAVDNKEIRRANMMALAEEAGSLRALADKTGTPARYLSNIQSRARTKDGKIRGMGDAVARRLEEKCGRPRGWMDKERPTLASLGGDKLLLQLIEFYTNVTEERQAAILSRAQLLYNEQYPGKSHGNPYAVAPPAEEFIKTREGNHAHARNTGSTDADRLRTAIDVPAGRRRP